MSYMGWLIPAMSLTRSADCPSGQWLSLKSDNGHTHDDNWGHQGKAAVRAFSGVTAVFPAVVFLPEPGDAILDGSRPG